MIVMFFMDESPHPLIFLPHTPHHLFLLLFLPPHIYETYVLCTYNKGVI